MEYMTKEEILQKTNAFLFDLDGTLYLGETPIGDAAHTLQTLRKEGKKLVFLTNNSSKTQREYREKLSRIGLFSEEDFVFTSGMATISFLQAHRPKRKVYLLGTRALREEFEESGISLTEDSPDVCVLAYDTELTFEKIRKFDGFLRTGVEFIATHPDDVCPTADGSMPDVGSFLAMFARSSGRSPDIIIGKPYSEMAEGLCRLTGLSRKELCMVGDRMYTDIRFANNNGILSVLVLSGETTSQTLGNFPDHPDLILESVNQLAL